MIALPSCDHVDVPPVGWVGSPDSGERSVPLERRALTLAAVLREHGVKPGDRVLLATDNTPKHLVAILALIHLDTSIVLVDTRESTLERGRIASIARARWIIGDGVVSGRPGDPDVTPLDLGALLVRAPVDPPPDHLRPDHSTAAGGPAALDFGSWLARTDAVVTWTRRATGQAIGIVRSGRCVLRELDHAAGRAEALAGELMLPAIALSQVGGLIAVLVAWAAGTSVLLVPTATSWPEILQLVVDSRVNVLVADGPTYRGLLDLVERRPEVRHRVAEVRAWRCTTALPDGFAEKMAGLNGATVTDRCGPSDAYSGLVPHPGAWVLHEDPIELPASVEPVEHGPTPSGQTPHSPAQAEHTREVRRLLYAVRDDPDHLERIVRKAQEFLTGETSAQALARVLDAELSQLARGRRPRLACDAVPFGPGDVDLTDLAATA